MKSINHKSLQMKRKDDTAKNLPWQYKDILRIICWIEKLNLFEWRERMHTTQILSYNQVGYLETYYIQVRFDSKNENQEYEHWYEKAT